MAIHGDDPLWVMLRAHLAPALMAYQIADVEVAFTTEQGVAIQGTQFRDSAGVRVSRLQVPQAVAERLQKFCQLLIQAANLCDGEGVLSICNDPASVILQHQPFGESNAMSRHVWQL